MLKGAGRKPIPLGDHREKQIVAATAMIGGETNFEMKSARL